MAKGAPGSVRAVGTPAPRPLSLTEAMGHGARMEPQPTNMVDEWEECCAALPGKGGLWEEACILYRNRKDHAIQQVGLVLGPAPLCFASGDATGPRTNVLVGLPVTSWHIRRTLAPRTLRMSCQRGGRWRRMKTAT